MTSASAEQTKLPLDPAAHTVVVPYDIKKPLTEQKPQRYYMDRESFERLWSLAKENRKPEKPEDDGKPAVSIHSAAYKVEVDDERVLVYGKFEVGTKGTWTRVGMPIDCGDSSIAVFNDWVLDGKPVSLVDGLLLIEKPGTHVVDAIIELRREQGWKKVAFNLPQALAASVLIGIPWTDGIPEIEGAKDLTESSNVADGRIFTAVLGRPNLLSIKRSPRRPLADASPPATAETELIIGHTSGSAQSLLGTVRFEFPGTERTRFSLAVDADWQIAGWDVRQNGGEVAVKHWAARDADGRRQIDFELDRPVADAATVSIRGTRNGRTGAMRTPVLEPSATKGQQTIALLQDETIQLTPRPAADQRRIDKPAAMNAAMNGGRGRTTEMFFKTPAKQTLAYSVEAAPAKGESHTDYVFQLSEQKQEMMAAVTLKSGRDAWSQLKIALPAEFEIQSVDGPALAGWKQEKDDLFLQFNPAVVTTEARVLIYLARSVVGTSTDRPAGRGTGLQPRIEPLRFTGFEKVAGSALIVAHAATDAKLSDFKATPDLQETDPTKAADVFAIMPPQEKKRALKFERGDWSAGVSLTKQPVRFSSDGVVLAQATDAGLLVSQQVAFYIEQGALNRVTVKLPASLPEATVKGESLREVQTRVNGAVREYECSFQSDVLTHTALTLDMELPTAGELSLPFVDVTGAERLRRFFVLDNSSSRESKTIEATAVESCAKSALPYVPDVLSQPTFYRGKGGAGALKVAYEQLQSTEGNAAIVTLADITSAWRADGERWDTVVYSVFNRSLQFLPVILPENAELISVAVSGESVRADQEKGADGRTVRLIPLIQTRAGQRSLAVKLVYRLAAAGPSAVEPVSDWFNRSMSGSTASLRMDDPELVGISAERTVWTAIVPKRYSIKDIDGNMEEVAEESQVVERLQGLVSDLNRLNKAISLRNVLSYEESGYAMKEAEKLSKQIEGETRKVEDARRRKFDFYSREKKQAEGDDDKEVKLQTQVDKDLGELQLELGKQVRVLSENRAAVPQKGKKLEQATRLQSENAWTFNNAAAQKSSERESFANAQELAAKNVTDAAGRQSIVAFNDNTAVQNDFLNRAPVAAGQDASSAMNRLTPGLVAGTGGITIAKAGAGLMTLSGTNTYTGATTVNAGTLMVSNSSFAMGDIAANESMVIAGAPITVTGGTTLTLNGGVTMSGRTGAIGGVISNEMPAEGRGTAGGLAFGQSAGGLQAQAGQVARQSNVSQLGSNARANAVTQSQTQTQSAANSITFSGGVIGVGSTAATPAPSAIDGLVAKPELLRAEDRKAMTTSPAQGAPPPAPAAGAVDLAMRESVAADPFAAPAPMPTERAKAQPSLSRVAGREMARRGDALVGFNAPQIPQSFGLEAQVASQLRATGRRSLMIEVPSDGTAYHFRKLKDHAVLELKLRKAWTSEEKSTAIWLGVGLALWLLLAKIARRRESSHHRSA